MAKHTGRFARQPILYSTIVKSIYFTSLTLANPTIARPTLDDFERAKDDINKFPIFPNL